jgi:hypothetical protein
MLSPRSFQPSRAKNLVTRGNRWSYDGSALEPERLGVHALNGRPLLVSLVN